MRHVEPKFKKDVLDTLLHYDGIPAAIRLIEEYINGIKQVMAEAGDEIERLRARVKELEKNNRSGPIKRLPSEWEEITKIKIVDADGWRCGGKDWHSPISFKEWTWRKDMSTCRPIK
jgi:hypothetical protein